MEPALLSCRSVNTADVEDMSLHLLMLYRPTRREVTDWIDPYNNETFKYSSMARDYFGVDRLRELAPALATLFEALGEQMVPAPGELSLADLCATAPQLNDLLPTQKDLVLDLLADYQFDFLEKQILITGSSGSGKSYVLRFFMRYFFEQPDCEPVLLAPSGVAANNISGHTIHRFFNIPRTESSGEQPDCDPVRLALRIRQLKAQGKRPCLLIDEVSMVSSPLLEIMSQGLRQALDSDKPFGGCTVIFFGDFGQLGPVEKGVKVPYIWTNRTGDYLAIDRYDLVCSARQREDMADFVLFLEMLRMYNNSDINQRQILTTFVFAHKWQDQVDREEDYFFVFSRSERAKEFNHYRLESIATGMTEFWSLDGLGRNASEQQRRTTESQTGLQTVLRLKVGARVMCVSNIHVRAGIVNGTMGIVDDIRQGHHGVVDSVVRVNFDGVGPTEISAECRSVMGKTYSRTQFPLTLAWASTVHKCQSLTLPKVCISLKDLFTPGLLYVAVSRVRFHDDLRFIDLPERVDNHPADFASVHVPSDVRIHVTKELEDLYWRPAALTQMPGAIDPTISQAPSASQEEPFDQDLEDEFYLAEEDENDFFAEYDNDDFFLEKEGEEENVLQDLEEVEEEEEEEEVLQRTYHFPRKQ